MNKEELMRTVIVSEKFPYVLLLALEMIGVWQRLEPKIEEMRKVKAENTQEKIYEEFLKHYPDERMPKA